ncbi:MAG TPA: CatB-related O-acetyltransferase [Rhizomicrobium sp.]|nr:CatB-related O-acetyltransferase [Rhizomicrobium sp.]
MLTVETDLENIGPDDLLGLDGRVRLGPGAKLSAGTRIEAPIFIAQGARILRGVTMGRYAYVGRNTIAACAEIGRYVSIAHDSQINYFRAHPTAWLSTHPFQFEDTNFAFWPGYAAFQKKPFDADASQKTVTIGPDAWIGAGAYVFGGLTIGTGAIVGARAMVRQDIPPYAVAVGMPAVVKSRRFDDATIARLLKTRWWERPEEEIRALPFNDIARCLDLLEESPA